MRLHFYVKLMCCAFSFVMRLVHEFSCSLLICVFSLVTCRHLVWEDGSCGHASCYTGSDAPEAGCEPGTSVCTLVGKVMASQIHVIGEG
jgi:hypothetical protein